MSEEANQRPKRLTAKRKFELYLETRNPEAPIGGIPRRSGVHLADLRRIEEAVERGAVSALKVSSGRQARKRHVTPEEYERLAMELREKEKALADLTVEYQPFKKKTSARALRTAKRANRPGRKERSRSESPAGSEGTRSKHGEELRSSWAFKEERGALDASKGNQRARRQPRGSARTTP